MADEGAFNRYAAQEFITEYYRETEELLRFKRCGDPFPDVILEGSGREIGVEFVSIVLPFVNQEHGYFSLYRQAFLTKLQKQRPRYRNVIIRLQPHHERVESSRPIRLPNIDSPEGSRLIDEFAQLLEDQFEDLSRAWGGDSGGALLDQLRTGEGALRYPVLSKHFGAIIFQHVTPADVAGSPAPAEDPIIADPVVWYSNIEVPTAVRRALGSKAAKGPAYSSDLLVLHTLPKPGTTDISGIGLQADELAGLGKALLPLMPELQTRFREIWFLNQYFINGKRLYRLS